MFDTSPVLPVSLASPSLSLDRVLSERGYVEAAELERLTGIRSVPTIGQWVVSPEKMAELVKHLRQVALASGQEGINIASLTEIERAIATSDLGGLLVIGNRVLDSSFVQSGLSERATTVLHLLEADPWSPPEIPLSERARLRELERAGLACEAGAYWFASSAVRRAIDLVAEMLEIEPKGFTVSSARQAMNTNRKCALALLAHLDSLGATRREGDLRLAGARLKELRSSK